MKKEGTRICLHQDTKSLITPSLHLLFCFLFVCYECIRRSNILTSNCLHENVRCSLGRNKDVYRDGVMSDFVPCVLSYTVAR